MCTAKCKNIQAGADTGYGQGCRDINITKTVISEVEMVVGLSGPSGVCATGYLHFSSPISRRKIFKQKSVADMLGVFGGGKLKQNIQPQIPNQFS